MTEPSKTPRTDAAEMNAQGGAIRDAAGGVIDGVTQEEAVIDALRDVARAMEREVAAAKSALSEERSRAERAESIADMSAIELIRSCTVSLAGTDYRDPMGEDLEPELAYAVARGLVELDAKGWLRFTEYAWQRCSEEAPK